MNINALPLPFPITTSAYESYVTGLGKFFIELVVVSIGANGNLEVEALGVSNSQPEGGIESAAACASK
jgi:hypothetical protein